MAHAPSACCPSRARVAGLGVLIPDAPGRKAILATIKVLEAQTATTFKIAEALDLNINTTV